MSEKLRRSAEAGICIYSKSEWKLGRRGEDRRGAFEPKLGLMITHENVFFLYFLTYL